MNEFVLYEQPMHEIIRICLRLECLFAQIDYHVETKNYWNNRATIATIADIVNILDRPDFKAKLTKQLIQCKENLRHHLDQERVDQKKLQQVLNELNSAIQFLQQVSGKLNQSLEQDEFFNSIRLRLSKTGGARNFDLPRYHYWLHLPEQTQSKDIKAWLKQLADIRVIIDLYLMLIRQSTLPFTVVAENGYYEKVFDSSVDYQLLRIYVNKNATVFPDISVGRHRMSLHFFTLNTENEQPVQYKNDITFKLALCL
jgi:cell division protein ZapD